MPVLHNIPPVFDENSRILILGSFPSVKSREGEFFYHHPQNRFWRVLAAVYGCEAPASVEEKRAFLLRHGAALWDVIASCEITGSSDASIRNAVPNDVSRILRAADIQHVYTNGQTAHRLYRQYLADGVRLPETALPSTSPANAAWSLERLAGTWRVILPENER
ncbi:MAG: DNA-deoxyinosine glycosylase [Hominenteromicrobium sp.]